MDGVKYIVFIKKSIRSLVNNQYTSNIKLGSSRIEIKYWVKLFFNIKVITMNNHRLSRKGKRMGPIMGHIIYYKYMVIILKPSYSILPFIEKKT